MYDHHNDTSSFFFSCKIRVCSEEMSGSIFLKGNLLGFETNVQLIYLITTGIRR